MPLPLGPSGSDEETAQVSDEQQDESDDASMGEGESENLRSALDPGISGQLDQIPEDLGLEPTPEDADHLLEVLGAHVRVTQTVQTDVLPRDLAEQLTGPVADYADDVSAAEGETFYVAVPRIDDPQHDGAEPAEDLGASLRLAGNEVIGTDVSSMGTGEQITVVVSAPADTAPEDLVYQSVWEDMTQELSLVDGSRTDSDVEHIYSRPDAVEIGEDASWSEDYSSYNDQTQHLEGALTRGIVLPAHPKLGWARPGSVYLGLDATTNRLPSVDADETTIVITLPDGSTMKWIEDPASLTHRFANRIWYEIPSDVTEATAAIDVVVNPWRKDTKELTTLEVPLTFTRDED